METKTQQAINLWEQKKIVPSLKIFKSFKIGVSKDDKRNLEIAYECLTGKRDFYESIQVDVDSTLRNAFSYLVRTYQVSSINSNL